MTTIINKNDLSKASVRYYIKGEKHKALSVSQTFKDRVNIITENSKEVVTILKYFRHYFRA